MESKHYTSNDLRTFQEYVRRTNGSCRFAQAFTTKPSNNSWSEDIWAQQFSHTTTDIVKVVRCADNHTTYFSLDAFKEWCDEHNYTVDLSKCFDIPPYVKPEKWHYNVSLNVKHRYNCGYANLF